MRNIFLSVALLVGIYSPAQALLIPAPLHTADKAFPAHPSSAGLVNDLAGVMPDEKQRTQLESDLRAFEHDSKVELVVVSIPSLNGMDIETYTNGLFRSWGIGKKGADNGVLLILAPHEKKARIEVGYRLEPILTDADSKQILLTSTHDRFHSGDFSGGMISGAHAIMDHLRPKLAVEGKVIMLHAPTKSSSTSTAHIAIFVLIVFFGIPTILIIMAARVKSNHDEERKRNQGGELSSNNTLPTYSASPARSAPLQTSGYIVPVESPSFSSKNDEDDSYTSKSDSSGGFGSSSSGSDFGSDSSSSSGFDMGGGSSGGGGSSDSF